jgi:hypothetical protein
MTTSPSPRFKIELSNARQAERTRKSVKVGSRFVFVADGAAGQSRGRLSRLLGRSGGDGERKVFPLVDRPVVLDGLRVVPPTFDAEPLHALVTDRDLYRAEQDTVNLFVAMPAPPKDLRLVVEYAGEAFTERPLDTGEIESLREHGVHVEPLAMLLPGDYSAQLAIGERRIGRAVTFTVAEYTLAPLSGRLVTHALDRGTESLSFALQVDSYERPFEGDVNVELLSGADVVDQSVLSPVAPGRFEGALGVSGEGALRLRLVAVSDAERSCEVVIPGSRRRERDTTVVNELGLERLVALMPEPGALSLRGAYLSEGDYLGTPVVADDVVGAVSRLQLRADVESLTTITVDLATGQAKAKEHGDVSEGAEIEVEGAGAASTIFVGGWVKGRPFEGFTHLFRPADLEVGINATHVAGSGVMSVELSCSEKGTRPVLLCVRDERLTATDVPDVSMSASMKRAIEEATAGLGDDWVLTDLSRNDPWTWLKAGVAPIDLDARKPTSDMLAYIHAGTAEQLLILPIDKKGETATVAMARPGDAQQRQLAEGMFGWLAKKLVIAYAPEAKIREVIAARRGEFQHHLPPPGAMPVSYSGATRGGGGRRRMRSISSFDGVPDTLAGAAPVDALYEDFDDEAISAEGSAAEDLFNAAEPEMARAQEAPMAPRAAPAPLAKKAKSVAAPAPMQAEAVALDKTEAKEGGALVKRDEVLPAPPTEAEPPRTVFPEVVFYGLVEVDGRTTIELPLEDALGTFTVEAFALTGADWARAKETVVVDQPLRVDLVVPPAVHPEDEVSGTLRAAAAGGDVRVTLTRDGESVTPRLHDGAALEPTTVMPSPVELSFALSPGVWVAEVEDVATGARDSIERIVDAPGELRSYVREVGFLQQGDALNLHEAGDDVLSLRVLPGLDAPMGTLVKATAGYAHLCCEQTAAKMLSAVAMYLSASTVGDAKKAEQIIVAGVARERKMHLPGKGFAMYPGGKSPSDYWSQQAVRHLWKLQALAEVPTLSTSLRDSVQDALAMADDAGAAHGLDRVPANISSAEEAYVVASAEPARADEAARWVLGLIDLDGAEASVSDPRGAVHNRCVLSYAAATLLLAGDVARGVRVANVVTRQLNADGRMYSTVDSVAAIALLGSLASTGVSKGDGEVIVNGTKMRCAEAAVLSDQVETLEVVSGVCIIELSAVRTERWSDYENSFGVRVGFRGPGGDKVRRFAAGDRAELVVELLEGYKSGDLVHVALPASLSWLKGGGKVQRFTVDFEGDTQVRVPVLVTGRIDGKQRFAVCVRNMFEEERASNPGLLTVDAA